MSKVTVKVNHWYNTVSPESAEHGEYESTGNDCRDWEYSVEELGDAVRDFLSLYREQFWDCRHVEVNEVLYAADPVTDYHTGYEDRDCLCLSVHHSEAVAPDYYHQVRDELQRLIDVELNK